MSVHSRSNLPTGAKGLVSGVVSNGATWIESFSMDINGAEIPGANTSTWKFVFKQCDGGPVCLTLTSGAQITVTQNTTSTIFAINCPKSSLSGLCGDYQADFAQQDATGNIIHWLNGVVTFKEENLGF